MNRQNLMKCIKPHRGEGDTAERDEHLELGLPFETLLLLMATDASR